MFGSEQHGLNAANGLNAIDSIVRQTAGNKDAIKELIQTGVISEMQGVLAGMRADEIAKAGMLNKGNMPSVAQQVLTPQPPAGLGALPQGAPQMGAPAPQMPMPPQAPQEMQPQEPGMAGGGLAGLPVPDDMFNSAVGDSDTQQYDNGGLVAFSGGGAYNDFRDAIVEQESHGDYTARNPRSGASGKYQLMPATAKALSARLGLGYHPELLTANTERARAYQDALGDAATQEAWKYGGGDIAKAAGYYQGGPNTKGWGENNAKYQEDITRRLGGTGPMARHTGDNPTSVPDVGSIADNFEFFQGILGKKPTEKNDAYLEAVGINPEQSKKDKDRDLGYALIAASQAFNKPGAFLSNLGSAFGAMAEPLREGEKSRKAEKLAGLKAAADAERADWEERRGLLAPAASLYAEQMRGREAALGRKQHGEEFTTELQAKREMAAAQLQNYLDVAKIKVNPSDFDTMLQIQMSGTPQQKAAMDAALKAKAQATAQAQMGMTPGFNNAGGASAPGGNVVDFSSLK